MTVTLTIVNGSRDATNVGMRRDDEKENNPLARSFGVDPVDEAARTSFASAPFNSPKASTPEAETKCSKSPAPLWRIPRE
jgi:hypothetical protein